jgi:hypothetical protein
MSYRIDLGALVVDVSPERVLVFPEGAREGEHLTVYLRPRESGAYAGLYTPHLSFPKANERRRWLGPFRPGEFGAMFGGFQEELLRQFAGASKLVTLESLNEQGWIVGGTDEVVQEQVKELFSLGERGFKFPISAREKLWALTAVMIERSSCTLDLDAAKRGPHFLMRLENDRLEEAMLGYYPHGLYGPPGWYVTRFLDFTTQIYTTLIMNRASEQMIRALLKIARFLGGEPPEEWIDLLRRKQAERRR